jgi:ABC-2 type transport system permease protein
MWQRIIALIWKELLIVWRDKRSRFVLIVPPLTQLFIFAFAATLDVKNVPIGILNLDNGEKGIELVQRFIGSPFFSKIVFLKGVEEIRPFIDSTQGLMVVMLDAQFSRNLDAGKPADIMLILDGRRSNSAQIAAGYTSKIVDQYNDEFTTRANIRQQNSTLVIRNWFNPNLQYYWFNVPSLSGILTLLIGMVITSLSVAREKEIGTFDQLLVSPLTPLEILIGKMIPAIIIGIGEATIVLVVGTLILGVPFRGSIALFYISVFVFVTSIVGIGLFISSIAQTQQQAVLGSWLFMSPAIILSGFATPIENMPTWLQPVTYIIPLRYFLVIAKGLFLKDIPPIVVWDNIWPMALIGMVTLFSAGQFFKRKLE